MSEPALTRLPKIHGTDSLPDQLAGVLERAIIDGVLEPGERLNAEDLARHFQVSRIPVREALRTLHASGWVHIEPRHGVFVRERDIGEVGDLFETRLLLEDHAARLAAARRSEPQLRQLQELVSQGRAAGDAGDASAVGTINTEFHATLAACTGNAVLAAILRGLSQRIRWYYSAVSDQRGVHSMEEHAALVDAVRDQEPESAAVLIRSHIDATRQALERVLGTDAPRPHGPP